MISCHEIRVIIAWWPYFVSIEPQYGNKGHLHTDNQDNILWASPTIVTGTSQLCPKFCNTVMLWILRWTPKIHLSHLCWKLTMLKLLFTLPVAREIFSTTIMGIKTDQYTLSIYFWDFGLGLQILEEGSPDGLQCREWNITLIVRDRLSSMAI